MDIRGIDRVGQTAQSQTAQHCCRFAVQSVNLKSNSSLLTVNFNRSKVHSSKHCNQTQRTTSPTRQPPRSRIATSHLDKWTSWAAMYASATIMLDSTRMSPASSCSMHLRQHTPWIVAYAIYLAIAESLQYHGPDPRLPRDKRCCFIHSSCAVAIVLPT